MSYEERLNKYKTYIRINDPFFASLMSNITFEIEDSSSMVMATNCINKIYYSPSVLEEWTDANTIFVIRHELCHKAYMHNLAYKDVEYPKLLNCAQDFIINNALMSTAQAEIHPKHKKFYEKLNFKHITFDMLIDAIVNKTELTQDSKKPNILLDNTLHDLSSVEIYNKIIEKLESEDALDSGTIGKVVVGSGFGDIEDDDSPCDKSTEISQKGDVLAAIEVAKSIGKTSNPIIQHLEEMLEPQVDWKSVVQNWMNRTFEPDVSIQTPHYLSQSLGVFIRGVEPRVGGAFAFVCDQSGSMSNEERRICMTELHTFWKNLDLERLEFICFDSTVTQHQTFEYDDDFEPVFKGSGGTCVAPAIDLLNQLDVDGVIFVTDGYIADWENIIPNCPSFCLITSHSNTNSWNNSGCPLPEYLDNHSFWNISQ